MQRNERIKALVELGHRLSQPNEYLEAIMHRSFYHNKWFTIENQQLAIQAIAQQFLEAEKLKTWVDHYDLKEPKSPQKVGIIMAGNIPLVGFHDLLCVFVAGHYSQIKLSEKDQFLLPYIIKLLGEIDSRSGAYFEVSNKLKNFDAVIATGSDNSARYFEAYFGKYPHIIRKNRNAIAVLTGTETESQFAGLGTDIFQFFGLGCRNVSKLYVPTGYNFDFFLEYLHDHHKRIVLNEKYKNNFDYNYAMYVINKEPFKAIGCLLLIEKEDIPSRIASLHYEYYDSLKAVDEQLQQKAHQIQCVIAGEGFLSTATTPFGKAQRPTLMDYPDGVDVLNFLNQLGS